MCKISKNRAKYQNLFANFRSAVCLCKVWGWQRASRFNYPPFLPLGDEQQLVAHLQVQRAIGHKELGATLHDHHQAALGQAHLLQRIAHVLAARNYHCKITQSNTKTKISAFLFRKEKLKRKVTWSFRSTPEWRGKGLKAIYNELSSFTRKTLYSFVFSLYIRFTAAKEHTNRRATNKTAWQSRGTSVAKAWHGCIVYFKTCQGVLAGSASASKNMPKEVGRFSPTSQQRSHNE